MLTHPSLTITGVNLDFGGTPVPNTPHQTLNFTGGVTVTDVGGGEVTINVTQYASGNVTCSTLATIPNLSAVTLASLGAGYTPVAGESVLVIGPASRDGIEPTSTAHSGKYVVGPIVAGVASFLPRSTDADTAVKLGGSSWLVETGTYAGYVYVLPLAPSAITLESTLLPFAQHYPLTNITDSQIATANKDGTAATPSMRTLGTGTLQACAGDDSRLSNSRTPLTHASTHVTSGGDTIADAIAAGNSGLMSGTDKTKLDGLPPSAVPTTTQVIAGTGLSGGGALSGNVTLTVSYGSTSTTACVGDDTRLSNARAPTTHASSHVTSGGDIITNVTSTASGLCPAGGLTGIEVVPTVPGAYPYTAQITDRIIDVDTSSARSIILDSSLATNTEIEIRDATGNATTNNITISATSGSILGPPGATTININYDLRKFKFDSANWREV